MLGETEVSLSSIIFLVRLREERSHLIAQMEAGEGEAVARAQIAKENEVLRKQNEEAEEKWRKKIRLLFLTVKS